MKAGFLVLDYEYALPFPSNQVMQLLGTDSALTHPGLACYPA
jgi:hypothetical protein